MSDAIRKLGRHTSIYLLGVLANRLTGFVMLPIYTSYLTPADYGVLELLSLTVEAFGIVGGLALSSSLLKFHAEYGDASERKEVLSTGALALAGSTAIVTGLGIALSTPISDLVLGEQSQPVFFRIFFGIYLLQQAEIVPLLLLRIQERPVPFVLVNLAKLALMLTLNIWLVVFKGMGVMGVLLSNLSASALFSSGLTLYLFASVGTRFSIEKFRAMLRFGLPMILWFIGSFVMVSSDRFFLNHYAGASDVGIYALAYRFMSILPAIAFGPFFQAWDPQRFELAGRADAGDVFTRVFTYCNLAVAVIAMGIAVFTQDVLRVMADPRFHDAYRTVPILLAAQIMWSLVTYTNLGLLLKNRTDILGWLAIVSVFTVLGLNFALIPRFGILGAALATLGAYGARFVLVLVTSQRLYHIDYDWLRVFQIYGVVTLTVVVKFSFPTLPILASAAVGLALILVAMAALYVTVLDSSERSYLATSGPRLKRLLSPHA